MEQLFLVDDTTGAYVELDVDTKVIELIYSIGEIADIEQRKDNYSRTIQLKSTPNNDRAFGHLFLLHRNYRNTVGNKLFFNYSPLRKVQALIYSDNILVMNGYMQVSNVKVNSNGSIIYDCAISGSIAGIKDELKDKQLSDLDLSDMRHTYNYNSIIDSWGGKTNGIFTIGQSRTFWKDTNGNTVIKPFSKGTGYVYVSSIDYGMKFAFDENNTKLNLQRMQNLKPQVYGAELLKRVLANIGYTYEIQGSPTLVDRFNSVIIPDNTPDTWTILDGIRIRHYLDTSTSLFMMDINQYPPQPSYTTATTLVRYPAEKIATLPLPMPGEPGYSPSDMIIPSPIKFPYQNNFNGAIYNSSTPRQNNVFRINRDMKTSLRVSLFATVKNLSLEGIEQSFSLQLVKRDSPLSAPNSSTYPPENDSTSYDDWTVVREQNIIVKHLPFVNGVAPNQFFNVFFEMEELELTRKEEFMFRIKMNYYQRLSIILTSGWFTMGKDENSKMAVTIKNGDTITPRAPMNLTQYDYFKDLLKIFNLYCYSERQNPKHLILKTYNDYYAKASPINVKNTALNISNRLDISKGYEIKSNLSIPKNYIFKYTEDSDFLNDSYKKMFNEAHGTLKFNDSLGTGDTKTIELKFAPSPLAKIDGQEKYSCFFTKDEVNIKKAKMQVKPRILFYSGVFGASLYSIADEVWQNHIDLWQPVPLNTLAYYSIASPYYFSANQSIHGTPFNANGVPNKPVPIDSLNFNNPKGYFFATDNNYITLTSNIFSNYYSNQIAELINPNLHTLTINVKLDSFSIGELTLDTPVFIDVNGSYSYYKILSIEYMGSDMSSKMTLQKIV